MKVFVYFNLHKRCFSIKALEGAMKGRVIAHRDQALLSDAKFKVSEAGRQRVLKEKRKNVHAGVVGDWIDSSGDYATIDAVAINGSAITYNPYKYSTFVHLYGEHPIGLARLVALTVTENKTPRINVWN
jgi:hypothetical protein